MVLCMEKRAPILVWYGKIIWFFTQLTTTCDKIYDYVVLLFHFVNATSKTHWNETNTKQNLRQSTKYFRQIRIIWLRMMISYCGIGEKYFHTKCLFSLSFIHTHTASFVRASRIRARINNSQPSLFLVNRFDFLSSTFGKLLKFIYCY